MKDEHYSNWIGHSENIIVTPKQPDPPIPEARTCGAFLGNRLTGTAHICCRCGMSKTEHDLAALRQERDELKGVLARIEAAFSGMGIYPAAFSGKYEKRCEFKNGWNAAIMEWAHTVCREIMQLQDKGTVADLGEALYAPSCDHPPPDAYPQALRAAAVVLDGLKGQHALAVRPVVLSELLREVADKLSVEAGEAKGTDRSCVGDERKPKASSNQQLVATQASIRQVVEEMRQCAWLLKQADGHAPDHTREATMALAKQYDKWASILAAVAQETPK